MSNRINNIKHNSSLNKNLMLINLIKITKNQYANDDSPR